MANGYGDTPSLTSYVADFITSGVAGRVPGEVIALGKKSILDGLGLALSGSIAASGRIVNDYVAGLGSNGPATLIGTGLKTAPRFAAFANGVAIHADDYDDTQLAVAKDRVYGLLTHPTAPCLPAVLAIAERDGRTGADLMGAYHVGLEVECKISEAIIPPPPAARSLQPQASPCCRATMLGPRAARYRSRAASRPACVRISAP